MRPRVDLDSSYCTVNDHGDVVEPNQRAKSSVLMHQRIGATDYARRGKKDWHLECFHIVLDETKHQLQEMATSEKGRKVFAGELERSIVSVRSGAELEPSEVTAYYGCTRNSHLDVGVPHSGIRRASYTSYLYEKNAQR